MADQQQFSQGQNNIPSQKRKRENTMDPGDPQRITRSHVQSTDPQMAFDPQMQAHGTQDLQLDHSQLNHSQMELMGMTPNPQQDQQQQQQQQQQQPQQQQGVDHNALSTAKAALAAQHSPESKYPPPDTFQSEAAALAHGLGGYTPDSVNQHVNQVMQMSQIPDQSGTPQHHPQPGQLGHVPQVTQTHAVATTTTTAPPPTQTSPAVSGTPSHMTQQIAVSQQQSQTSQTANAMYAARESVSQKPNVGSPEWHTIRKNNHKEGEFDSQSVNHVSGAKLITVERRRREAINEGINEIAKMVPGCEKAKGMILQRAIQYISSLQQEAKDMAARWETANMTTSHALSEIGAENTKVKSECDRRGNIALKWIQRCREAGLQFPDYEEDEKSLGAVNLDIHGAATVQQPLDPTAAHLQAEAHQAVHQPQGQPQMGNGMPGAPQ
ncbi:AAA+-type ATPase [Ascosphaera pollenicola]|nr:AAA+-type ATPase [Ascosphaera pollenicola]